jgi:hypothetical protein
MRKEQGGLMNICNLSYLEINFFSWWGWVISAIWMAEIMKIMVQIQLGWRELARSHLADLTGHGG